MKVAIVGLGIQGRKRMPFVGADLSATVDPVAPDVGYRRVEDVPLAEYDAALVCTPDTAKLSVLEYLLNNGKHVLVEKPLLAANSRELEELDGLARRRGVACYTAYNHRFEPHVVSMKRLLEEGRLGPIYQARFFYGNGTARDFRNSGWRDQGLGVIPDLASHMFDLCEFFFGRPAGAPQVWSANAFENASPDYFLVGWGHGSPMIRIEGTLLSWRNWFTLDVVGEQGSAHVTGLCKWGPSSLVVRTRVLPSGKPPEEANVLDQRDPTWALEYEHFKGLCKTGGTNISTDVWINDMLHGIGRELIVEQAR